MKNLFKNLMLVVVAAMAFTACEKDIVGGEEQKAEVTTISVSANLDETRSYFGEKDTDNNAYPSFWEGTDNVVATVPYLNEYSYYEGNSATATAIVDTEKGADRAKFDFVFNGSLPYEGRMYFCVPAESVRVKPYYGDEYWDFEVTCPSEQTPSAGSVDPKAHVLTAVYAGVLSGDISVNFAHELAYGRMQIKNFAEKIENVKVTIDSKTYTLNAANVKNNLFWFGCQADEETSTVKVVVNTADKSYTKELDLKANAKGLPFVKGQVSTFSVNMEGVPADENTSGDEAAFEFPAGTHMWNKIEWNSDSSYFKITNSDYSTSTYWRIYLNDNDHENGTNIKPGKYKGYGKTTPPVGSFSTRITIGSFDTVPFGGISSVTYVNESYELIVDYSNGEYHILMKNGDTYHGFQGTI